MVPSGQERRPGRRSSIVRGIRPCGHRVALGLTSLRPYPPTGSRADVPEGAAVVDAEVPGADGVSPGVPGFPRSLRTTVNARTTGRRWRRGFFVPPLAADGGGAGGAGGTPRLRWVVRSTARMRASSCSWRRWSWRSRASSRSVAIPGAGPGGAGSQAVSSPLIAWASTV